MRLISYSAKENHEEFQKLINVQEHEQILQFNDVSCQASHLKNSEVMELSVSGSATLCLSDYRNQYQHFMNSNPMYTSNTHNKPWEVIAWIADKLVDELIVELSDDFQMEHVIQKMFDLEFQEF